MCTDPRIVIRIPLHKEKSAFLRISLYAKWLLKFIHYDSRHNCDVWYGRLRDFPFAAAAFEELLKQQDDEPWIFEVPCKKCLGCLQSRRNQWLSRCLIEAKEFESNLFITLTYNDEDCPPCLVRKDYQDYMKRLREALPYKVRQYYSGEYGELLGRPHFHQILFGMKLPADAQIRFWVSKRGKKMYHATLGAVPYYSSDWLAKKVWQHGHVLIAPVCAASIKYVANYLDKGKSPVGFDAPPFKGMSRRPALGRAYFNRHELQDCLQVDDVSVPCRQIDYFKRLVKELDPVLYHDFMDRFRSIAAAVIPPWKQLGISRIEYLERMEKRAERMMQLFSKQKRFETSVNSS